LTIDRGYRQFKCLDCGKTVREPRGFTGFNITNKEAKAQNVEIEYFDYCEKCGKTRLKEEKQRNRIIQVMSTGIVSEEMVKGYMGGKISKKVFWEEVNRQEKILRDARNATMKKHNSPSKMKKHNSPSKMKRLEKRQLNRMFNSFTGQCVIARGY